MKISIFSDLHLGFALNTPLENDSFEQARQAMEQSLDSDLIIVCGDIFDNRFPKPDILTRAVQIFSIPSTVKTETRLFESIKKNVVKQHEGIPVIALHGTHERVGREQYNAVQLLESAGLLYHLHKNGLIFEKNGIKVAIQGMSGVPERYASQILEEWSPQPKEGCYNILLLHQNIVPFIYSPAEPSTLTIDSLPEGFDLIINGHIHSSRFEKIGDKKIILAGSTIVTQAKKEEQAEKGIYKLLLPEEKVEFEPIKGQRKFIYEEIEIKEERSIGEQIKEVIEKHRGNYQKKPLFKIKLKYNRLLSVDKDMKNIIDEYSNEFIIKYSKELTGEFLEKKVQILREARESKISIEELGIKILEENIRKVGFDDKIDFLQLYSYMSGGDLEKAKKLILEGLVDDKSDNI
ncbi:MAG: DNA repair exonuclease [Candidatus Aenigmatarchaeota archaeon]